MVTVLRDERGLTLVEVLVSASLFVLALMMFGASLVVAQRMQLSNSAYSRANDQAHLAIASMDRQVRSGYVVGVTTGLGFATEAVKVMTLTGGSPTCVMWAVAPAGSTASLYTASWTPPTQTAPTSLSGMRTAATDLWNYTGGNAVTAFTVVPGVGNVLPALSVNLLLNATTRPEAAVSVATTLTSRNVDRATQVSNGGVLTC